MKLAWPNCVNVRDLGGLPTEDGLVTRHGALIRSDNHDRLSTEGIDAVRAVRPTRIIDVRSPYEAGAYPSPFRSSPEYRNRSLNVDGDDEPETLFGDYLLIVDGGRDMIAAAVITLAAAPYGPVVVHCHSGKDRAGILSALALRIAGVGAAVVADDYALTSGTDRQLMVDLLDHLDRRYGSVREYLLGSGVRPSHLDAIHERLRAT
ncbi:MAG TPA: tyrosine-protein phosphatase [Micromonosporaceae bacterium]|jgi:protein tyrosine/serine phosphatase